MTRGERDAPDTYEAFISYRHCPWDMAVAKEVERQLEAYVIPWGRRGGGS